MVPRYSQVQKPLRLMTVTLPTRRPEKIVVATPVIQITRVMTLLNDGSDSKNFLRVKEI